MKDQLAAAMTEYKLELEQQWRLPEHVAAKLLQTVTWVFQAACTALEAEHAALVETEQEVARVLNSRHGQAAAGHQCYARLQSATDCLCIESSHAPCAETVSVRERMPAAAGRLACIGEPVRRATHG